jgi:hypothetical protein
MYILKANSCRKLTHFKCPWKLVIAMIPLENAGSWVSGKQEGSLSEFFEFLSNFNNWPPKSAHRRSLRRTHVTYWQTTFTQCGRVAFCFILFSTRGSCLKVICYHHGSQLLDESRMPLGTVERTGPPTSITFFSF